MIVRNVLAVIGGVTVAAVVAAGVAVIAMKKMADAMPEDMLEDTEVDPDEIESDLTGSAEAKTGLRKTPLSPTTA
ncbi:hypothetical protein [Phytomonospora endophytica]|uniref:Uncharacterized protein n=1 Tax=Phytomonospora endophytica TaxID=714109 RepID=A0A841FEW1_9ACTN|nr:hypothetical protein [Phytomonospora endophytica]MBB6033533.1 hypothetical protein [Phytomonospora endophytica]GIG64949.1 hypothetical protein Pen01_12440 [Phytomonospora endophytica]